MKKIRTLWKVYRTYYLDAEEPEDCIRGRREYVGSTYAGSEAEAIRNVSFRKNGAVSPYAPVVTAGNWDDGYVWEAEENDAAY